MVHGQVPKREVDSTPVIVAFLPSVERVTVGSVVRKPSHVRPLRGIRPSDNLAERAVLIPEPLVHQLDGQRREVDTRPFPPK